MKQNPDTINVKFLEQYPEFIEFRTKRHPPKAVPGQSNDTPNETPEEALESAYLTLRSGLAEELLAHVKFASPAFFERLVIELLVKMGYGGTRRDAGQALGRSHDEGVDGIIKEDRLGLDVVYLQAKRWDAPVGRPEIQKFAGTLHAGSPCQKRRLHHYIRFHGRGP
ncbi:MAG: restriction endonuclease [Deltaproteobacteria bacterium]|nr:restriction endonuclease [Deltaproteobacteria bacterium]